MKRRAASVLLLGLVACGAGRQDVPPKATGATSPALPPSPPPEERPAASATPPPPPRERAPGFDGATAWLNVDHPLTLEELRGRVVIVDFWTSCCINCLHTLPTLRAIEKEFADQPVVVVGIQSPKFDEEREPERLRDILRDNGVEHPVAVDADMKVWEHWGVRGWPTVYVLDPGGGIVWSGSGEPDRQELSALIASTLGEARGRATLAKAPLRGLSPERGNPEPLRYPGKVLALQDGGVAIADTGNNRVVLVKQDGSLSAIVGAGVAGHDDGTFEAATFQHPEGLAEFGDDLYVADTNNHALRKIDRRAKTVATVAGTGELGRSPLGTEETPAATTALRSPWDVLAVKGLLYVALAGSHQIGVYEPKRATIRAYAGSGREAREDGALGAAAFAQPSALASDGKELFVLDSETSSVRAIDFAKGTVRTVVGRDLFVFGDVDGPPAVARLEHPIGLAYGEGALWVADTYNSKIKRVDPLQGTTKTFFGGGTELGEPAGLAIAGDSILVADTNHHRVLKVPRHGGGAAVALPLPGLKPPGAVAPPVAPPHIDARDPVLLLGNATVRPGTPTTLHIVWGLPNGTALNEAAPLKLTWAEGRGVAHLPERLKTTGRYAPKGIDLTVELAKDATAGSLTGTLDVVVCDVATHRACVPVKRTLKLDLSAGAASKFPLSAPLPAAD